MRESVAINLAMGMGRWLVCGLIDKHNIELNFLGITRVDFYSGLDHWLPDVKKDAYAHQVKSWTVRPGIENFQDKSPAAIGPINTVKNKVQDRKTNKVIRRSSGSSI